MKKKPDVAIRITILIFVGIIAFALFRPTKTTIPPHKELAKTKQDVGKQVVSLPQRTLLEETERKTGLKFVEIPAGTFLMGGEKVDSDEEPIHSVTLHSFHFSANLVTVEQYKRYCDSTANKMPEQPTFNKGWLKVNHPIVNVSWKDAKGYCDWAGLVLPTEAEWEYASRVGLKGKAYPWGDEWDAGKCVNGGNSGNSTVRVGSYPPNDYGLYDMVGNVWEWCSDWYQPDYYKSSPSNNPIGPSTGNGKVLRGGSWYDYEPVYFRCAYRVIFRSLGKSQPIVGFRPVFHQNRQLGE